MHNVLIGGAAGQGMDSFCTYLEKILQRKGFYLFSNKDYMSRVRGGHNFIQIRFGDKPVTSHHPDIDIIVAFDKTTLETHIERLSENGLAIFDEAIDFSDDRALKLPLSKIATELGLPQVAGVVALGALIRYLGISEEDLSDMILATSKKEPEKNKHAFEKGLALLDKSRLSLKKGPFDSSLLLDGNTAIALGFLSAGVNFCSAYPMTPGTSVVTYLAKKEVAAGIVVEQAEDEIGAINMALGASYAGARAVTSTSGGGFDLMVEALGLAGMAEIPVVIVNSQRPGPATGLPTRTEQSDLFTVLYGSHGEFPRIVLSVRNSKDCFYQAFRAVHLAEEFQTVVILLTEQYIADSTVTVKPFDISQLKIENFLGSAKDVDKDGIYRRYKLTESGISPRLIPGQVNGQIVLIDSDEHDEEGHITESDSVRRAMMDKRMAKLKLITSKMIEPDYLGDEKADVLFLCWGSLYGPIQEAVKILTTENIKIGVLCFSDIFPLPTKKLMHYTAQAKKIINIEQNFTGQFGMVVTQHTGIRMNGSILKYDGRQMNPVEIVAKVKEIIQ